MGKGKGSFSEWVAPVKIGQTLFEIEGIPVDGIKKTVSLLKPKSPVKLFYCKQTD